jgi:2-aminoadipate transaminase
MLGEILFNPGDIVITEAPSYFVYHSLLQSHGCRVLTVPMDEQGLDVTALEALLDQLQRVGELNRVKVIYTVDYFQNPTGLSLSAERRSKLVELVRRFSTDHRILVLEDAAYRELRYSGDDVPSVKSFDTSNEYVIYTGTFSKSLAPGLKTGYAMLPADVRVPLMHLKGSHDFGSCNLSQHIISQLLAMGLYAKHVEKLRTLYQRKRDIMLESLEREFGDFPGATWTVPRGGMFTWLSLEGIDTGPGGDLVAAALDAGVMYVPGEFGHVAEERDRLPHNDCRICFGVATHDQIREGIRRLRQAVGVVAKGPRGKRVKTATS